MGNLIYRQLPDGENQYYQYDLENQLVRAEIKKPAGNTEIWTYAYDPFGRRLSKERQDKLAWTSTDPKRTHFVWDGSRLLQEYTYKGSYTYIYTDQDSYEPLAQVFDNAKDGKPYLAYFHNDQVGIPREMTDIYGNLLWYGEYTAWSHLKKDECVYRNAHQPFRLQNQYYDEETGLHYNLMRYYEPEVGRFVNQDPIGLLGGANSYTFSNNALVWIDPLGLAGEAVLSPPKDVTLSTSKVKPIGRAGLLDVVLSLSGDTPNKEPFYYATYTRTHPVTGQVYCGRTHGIGDSNYLVHRRGLQQKHLNAEGFSPPVLDKYSTSPQAIRGREQQLIDFHGGAQSVGGTARNKINGVSAWNPNGPYYNWASTAEFGALPDNSPARMRLW